MAWPEHKEFSIVSKTPVVSYSSPNDLSPSLLSSVSYTISPLPTLLSDLLLYQTFRVLHQTQLQSRTFRSPKMVSLRPRRHLRILESHQEARISRIHLRLVQKEQKQNRFSQFGSRNYLRVDYVTRECEGNDGRKG